MRRIAKVVSPASFAAALLVFLLPFVSVQCDVPGGYGQMQAGGTTAYTGLDLATGSSPSVDAERLRPEAERESDDLAVQPLVALAAIGIIGALVAAVALSNRPTVSSIIGLVSAAVLVIGVLIARSTLVDKVALQAGEPFADGESAGDFVAIGPGFWLAAVLAIVGALAAFVSNRAGP